MDNREADFKGGEFSRQRLTADPFASVTYFDTEEEWPKELRTRRFGEDTPEARKRFCVYEGLQAMQFVKWGRMVAEVYKDEQFKLLSASDTREDYDRALDILILRFGDVFADTAAVVMDEHLADFHLDYPYHSNVRQSIAAGYLISQILTLPETTDKIIVFHSNANISGGNAWPLLGDHEFWQHVREKYPDDFHKLVEHMIQLSNKVRGNIREGAKDRSLIVDPIALVKFSYPEAYEEIVQEAGNFHTIFDIENLSRQFKLKQRMLRVSEERHHLDRLREKIIPGLPGKLSELVRELRLFDPVLEKITSRDQPIEETDLPRLRIRIKEETGKRMYRTDSEKIKRWNKYIEELTASIKKGRQDVSNWEKEIEESIAELADSCK